MKGERFKKRLPKFIGRISDMEDLFIAEDGEFYKIDRKIFDFIYALYVSSVGQTLNPDYFLRRLEKDYGLESAGTVNERISAVVLKMQAKRATTKEIILQICLAFGYPASYQEDYKNYSFILNLFVNGDLDMEGLLKILREVTPAHIWLIMHTSFARAFKIETRSGDSSFKIWLCGEHPCGEIPYMWIVGKPIGLGFKALSSHFDSRNYYGMTGEGHKSGQLRKNDNIIEQRFIQDVRSDRTLFFGGDD